MNAEIKFHDVSMAVAEKIMAAVPDAELSEFKATRWVRFFVSAKGITADYPPGLPHAQITWFLKEDV